MTGASFPTRTARVALAALAAAAAVVAAPAYGEDENVSTTANNRFTPDSVTITPGDSVTWTNNGGVNHTVTSTSDNWTKDSPLPIPGSTTSFTFEDAGTYTYFCETHGATMSGRVVVRAPRQSPKPSRSPAPTRSPSRSAQPSPAGSPTAAPTGPASPTPSPTGSPTPGVVSMSPDVPTVSQSPAGPDPTGTPFLGSGGLTPHSPVGRERGLPVLLAVLFLVGVITAELRTLLAQPREPQPPQA